MTQDIKINKEQRLYIIPCGGGYSCLGFDVAHNRAAEIAAALGKPELMPSSLDKGTLKGYAAYSAACEAARLSNKRVVLWGRTPPELQRLIESLHRSGERVRFHFGDIETGRVWLEEYDVLGRIGKSTGYMPCYILLDTDSASGGPALSTDNILRVQSTKSKADLYRHPKYAPPELRIKPNPYPESPEYTRGVYRDNELQAAFKSEQCARNYIAFMRGERMRVN